MIYNHSKKKKKNNNNNGISYQWTFYELALHVHCFQVDWETMYIYAESREMRLNSCKNIIWYILPMAGLFTK